MRRLLSIGLLFLLLCWSCQSFLRTPHSAQLSTNQNSAYNIIPRADTIRFNVANVRQAKEPLTTSDAKLIFENKVERPVSYMPREHDSMQLVAAPNNVLIQTLQLAFDEHRPLILTPDVIWLTICQGISIHINQHYDSLQSTLFKKDRPTELVVRNDSLKSDERSWANLISSLSERAAKHINENYYHFFVPDFSTSNHITKTAYEVTLMHTFKQAFTYVGESGCGIPSITLYGNKQDWQKIKSNLLMLDQFGLDYWRIELDPMLDQFIAVYENKIDLDFWNAIYKNMTDYNAFYLTGWIIKFFPYLETFGDCGDYNEEIGGYECGIQYKKNTFLSGSKHLLSTLSTSDFPSSILEVDLVWKNYLDQSTRLMNLYAGIFAIKQHNDMCLEPIISWAICENNSNKIHHNLEEQASGKTEHRDVYWSPQVFENPSTKPIFMPLTFNDTELSMNHLKKTLTDSLLANFDFTQFQGKTLTFVVLSNSRVEQVKFDGEDQIEHYLMSLLTTYDGLWAPAIARTDEVYRMWKDLGYSKKKMKVNCIVHITFDSI